LPTRFGLRWLFVGMGVVEWLISSLRESYTLIVDWLLEIGSVSMRVS